MLDASMQTHSQETDDASRPVATSHDDEPCTVSVPEASELFALAGLPRTERAIQRFCKKGELKYAFVETPFGSKYLIARSSIDRLIVQKQQAQKFAPETNVRDLSRPDATDRDLSRQKPEDESGREEPIIIAPPAEPHHSRRDNDGDDKERQGPTATPDTRDQTIEQLRGEIFDLKVDNAGKQNFIRQLVVDREKLMGEVKEISYELGAAQTRVAQLETPKVTYDMPRPDATDVKTPTAPPEPKTVTEAADARPSPPAPQELAPVKRRPWWRR
jgi:hypothetical protein